MEWNNSNVTGEVDDVAGYLANDGIEEELDEKDDRNNSGKNL